MWQVSLSNKPRRALVGFSYGLLFSSGLRRVISAAGYRVSPALFGRRGRAIAVWGRIPASKKVLSRYKGRADFFTFEDAFLRSVLPGLGAPPIGITVDDIGVHFDSTHASRLEIILQSEPLDDPELLQRARDGRAFLTHYGLSKYNPVARANTTPASGYVLVIDQVAGDASIIGGNANAQTFHDMLAVAVADNPDQKILVRTHPAVSGDRAKAGHFSTKDAGGNVELCDAPLNPHDLLCGASKVYCVSSQLGFEAILAGHRPIVFGLPFYAGWGLSEDIQSITRRNRKLNADQLFAAAMLVFPFWHNHATRRACSFEEAVQQLHVEARHYQGGARGVNIVGMRLWKRQITARFLNGAKQWPKFMNNADHAIADAVKYDRDVLVWAAQETPDLAGKTAQAGVNLLRMEDGFLRSNGLGAELTPASSVVVDDIGIHFDASRPSRLEMLISASPLLPEFAIKRAARLREMIVERGVTKYNIAGQKPLPELPSDQRIILVPGQVEDDASIKKGAGDVCTNLALLRAARQANPDAFVIYKPHPDVLTGLRTGGDNAADMVAYCDLIAVDFATAALIVRCDEVWTMTSLLGFEALLRGKVVTCLGMPFYAGWGLTNDVGRQCSRRTTRVTLEGLVHAALVDYPVYMDAVSGLPCTPELMVERLASGHIRGGIGLRILAKLQGVLAGYAHYWR